MTIGEVEEFLWSLSTCLEGRIGDWHVRFGGTTVSVHVDPHADQVVISAPIAFARTAGLGRYISPAGVRYRFDGGATRATVAARLSDLPMNGLQAGFQQVVDCARKAPST